VAAKDLYEKDFYKVLGVDKKAAADEIKKKYRSLARDLHPDKTKGDSAKEEQFKAVSEAYEILSDPKKAVAILETSSEAETRKIFSLICLVQPLVVADRAKDRIYKQRQRFHFASQYLAQLLIFV
jgi:curved DNA-binding protein CbpA